MLKKWILIFSLAISLGLVWAQVPIFNEAVPTFTDLPAGWTSNNGGGQAIMQTATSGYLLVDHADDWVVSSAYDLSNYVSVELLFSVASYGSGDNNPLTIEVSNDNGATWTYQSFTSATPTSSTYIDSGVFGISTNSSQVKFRFRRDAATGKGVRFRNILLRGEPLGVVPMLTVSPGSLSGFTYEENSGPSEEQSFTVSGTDLDGNISITAPTNYEVSLSSGSGFAASLNVNHSGGTVAETTVYVRLIAGLSVGIYDNETISIGAGTAVSKSVTLSGNVTAEPLEGGYLVHFDGATETKTSYASGTVNLSGLDWDMTEALIGSLAGDFYNGIKSARFSGKQSSSMTMLEDKTGGLGVLSFQYRQYGSDSQVAWKVEYSSDGGTSWTQAGSDFTATADVQTFSETLNISGNIRIKISLVTDTGTSNKRMNIDDILLTDYSGSVQPLITVSPGSLSGFTYEEDSGPSSEQSFVVSGSNLDANVSITAPTNFEISQTSGSGFDSILTLNHTGGTLAETTVYVRLKAGLEVGSYTDEIIDISSGTATAKTVTVSGSVTGPIPPAANLFFSEYIEGSSNNKALEIFNASDATVDLSLYKVELHSSAATDPGNTLTLSGTLASGEVYVIANASADPAILAEADVTSTVTYFNGDDALVLRYISTDTIIDQIGTIDGVDPGTGWEVAGVANATAEHTLIRKPSVETGSTNWVSQQGTDADDSEWVVLAQNYSENLGTHTFGSQVAASPIFNPPAGTYMAAIDVSISSETANATIYYTTDGSTPSDTNGSVYTSLIEVSETTTIKAIAYADGFEPSLVSEATYNIPISVSNIAELRTMPTGASNAYILTGEAIITFQQSSRNQKYIQDATGAILIDDPAAVITTTYNLYDGITGIAGTLAPYNELLQFTPVADPGPATSSNNVVIPEVRTLASLTSADQGKLIKVMNLTFNQIGDFSSYAQNIEVQDASGTLTLRTFSGADYAGTPIPAEPVNLVCLVGQFNTSMQIGHRFLSDIETISGQLDTPIVEISYDGDFLYLNWPAVDGANSYRVESANEPYAETFNTVGTTGDNTMVLMPTTPKKFYRVIALP